MADSIVECYQGLMGGGKSYMAVESCTKTFLRSGKVYTNLRLNFEIIKDWALEEHGLILDNAQYNYLTVDELSLFPEHISAGSDENPVLVVIDEAALFFNARDWSKTSKTVLEFLTQTRKVDVNIIFITQSIEDIDKQFRRRVHYTWSMFDLQKWVVFGFKCPFPYMIRTCYQGIDKRAYVHRKWAKKNPLIFSFYQSKQKFTDMRMKESEAIKLEKVNPTKPSRKPIFTVKNLLILFAVFAFGYYTFGRNRSPELPSPVSNSPVTYTAQNKPSYNEISPEPEPEVQVTVTNFQQNGEDYFIKFSDGTFLTHHSNVKVTYSHNYLLLDGIPFIFSSPVQPSHENRYLSTQ